MRCGIDSTSLYNKQKRSNIMNEIADKYLAQMLEGCEQNVPQLEEGVKQMTAQLEQMTEQRDMLLATMVELKEYLGLTEETDTPELKLVTEEE